MATCDIGIDLGTTNVKITIYGKGVVIDQPAVVAVDKKTGKLIAVGTPAYEMIGKNPESILVKYPLESGVISDYQLNELMIQELLRQASNNMLMKPRVCICVHTLITDVERRAVVDAAVASGARKVYLIEEPIAAALGSGVNLSEPKGVMVVDIGGGTTDVAVLSLNGIVASRSIKVGGQKMDEAIARKINHDYKLLIGLPTAEQAKIAIGTARNPDPTVSFRIRGRNLINGLPRAIYINQTEVYTAIREFMEQIVQAVRDVLEDTPPELVGDVYTGGILLTGGGALMPEMDRLIAEAIGVDVKLADEPCACVVIGTGKAFDMLDRFNTGFINAATYEH